MRKWIFTLILMLFSINAFALEQHEDAWFGVNTQKNINEKWLYSFFSQLRLINRSHPVQLILFDGGLGYQLSSDKSIWLGYRWTAHNPNNGFFQGNTLYEQLSWTIKQNDLVKIGLRSRFEQISHGNQNQIAIRLRERFSTELKYRFFEKINPYFFDEVFFQLNKTNFTANKLIVQNRLFLGFNLYVAKDQYWEIGYINQFRYKTPQASQNQMNHIISCTYNF